MQHYAEIIPETRSRQLRLVSGSHEQRLHALWLRERSPNEKTLDARTGQRLIEAASLPLDIAINDLAQDQHGVTLTFTDGHVAHYPFGQLDIKPSGSDHILWDSGFKALPEADFFAALESDEALLNMLEQLKDFGFVRVRGVPIEEEGMMPLVERLGPLRRTNWGGIADVKSIADAYDLTMTQRGLEPHTDNPYRDPIPGYIWLHCLSNADSGGDSTLADGFKAAEELRKNDPRAFECLTTVATRFRYADDGAYLESEGPLIELNSRSEVVRVRYNNRTELAPMLAPETLERYYAARQKFYALITSPALTLTPRLEPGDMMIMDNYRLLHGRTAFSLNQGVRHLRQGYVDRDTTTSRRSTLRRQRAGITPFFWQEAP